MGGATTNTNSRYQYGYDDAGNRTWVKRAHQSALGDVYTYDAADQLTNVLYNASDPDTAPSGWSNEVSYAFDAAGNRTLLTQIGGSGSTQTVSYGVNNLNQYTNVDATAYTYDTKGNLTGDGVWTYSYDYENRLVSATSALSAVQYQYDAFGRLIERQTSGTSQSTNRMYYAGLPANSSGAGWQLVAEYDGAGTLQTKYVYGPGIDEPVRMQRGSTKYYFEQDGLGNVTELENVAGVVLEQYTYDVYGTPTIYNNGWMVRSASLYGNRLMFTGRDRDPDTGLYNFRYRYYSPALGRFVQPDPMGLAGGDLNLYAYSLNNPVNLLDPSGLSILSWLKSRDWKSIFIGGLYVYVGFDTVKLGLTLGITGGFGEVLPGFELPATGAIGGGMFLGFLGTGYMGYGTYLISKGLLPPTPPTPPTPSGPPC